MWTSEEMELVAHRGDDRVLLRLVHAALPPDDDWWSHYERDIPPRNETKSNAMIHMSISCSDNPETLRSLAARFPKLGSFIAPFVVSGDHGIWFAETLWQGHFSVWGRPVDLQRCTHLPAEPV